MKRLVPLVGLLFLSGCPNRFHGFGVYGELTDPKLIVDGMKARAAGVKAVQGEAKAYLSSPKGSGKLAQYLVAQAPDHIRIEALSFFGDPIAVLTSDGKSFALHEIKENHFFEGPPTPQNVSRLLPVALPADELVSLVFGVPPLVPDGHVTGFGFDRHEGVYRMTYSNGVVSEVLEVETAKLQPVRVDMQARPGLSPYRAEFDDYDEKDLPKDIRLFAPDGKTKVELKWRSREVNPEIDPEVFTQEPPAGVPRTLLND